MRIPTALIVVTFLGFVLTVQAQERKESSGPAVYKVEFDIRDSGDGETQPSRHFSMLIDESRKGVFQAGSRVQVAVTSPQYVDVGANIECMVQESDGKIALQGVIELTSIAGYVSLAAISQPIIGQRKMAFNTTVELATPAVIINDRNRSAATPVSLDRTDVATPGITANPPAVAAKLQVEATVTKVH